TRRRLELLHRGEWVTRGLTEVEDVLLGDLGRGILRDVERAVAKARDVASRLSVGEEQVEDELAVVRVAPTERLDPLFDGLQVEPHHAGSVLTHAIPSGTTDIRASARVDGGRRAARVPSIRCYRWGYAGGRRRRAPTSHRPQEARQSLRSRRI